MKRTGRTSLGTEVLVYDERGDQLMDDSGVVSAVHGLIEDEWFYDVDALTGRYTMVNELRLAFAVARP